MDPSLGSKKLVHFGDPSLVNQSKNLERILNFPQWFSYTPCIPLQLSRIKVDVDVLGESLGGLRTSWVFGSTLAW